MSVSASMSAAPVSQYMMSICSTTCSVICLLCTRRACRDRSLFTLRRASVNTRDGIPPSWAIFARSLESGMPRFRICFCDWRNWRFRSTTVPWRDILRGARRWEVMVVRDRVRGCLRAKRCC
jgi:hypothetical protein